MRSSKTSDLALCALFVALIAMGAFLRVPVPLVPFTLQYLFTALAGLLLGAKKGCAAVCAYILLGLLGFPVFAQGGGIGYIFEPSFGYLIGFALGAYATGKVAGHTARPSFARLLAANLCGLAIVYLAGLAYCYCIRNFYLASPLGLWPLLLYGLVLAIPGDIALCVLAALLGKRLLPRITNVKDRKP